MSVIVMGMEMPRGCYECVFKYVMLRPHVRCELLDRKLKEIDHTERLPDCPLVALPEKHGRLVDADALSDEYVLMTGEVQGFRIEPLDGVDSKAMLKFKRWKDVPTIVEGEE